MFCELCGCLDCAKFRECNPCTGCGAVICDYTHLKCNSKECQGFVLDKGTEEDKNELKRNQM